LARCFLVFCTVGYRVVSPSNLFDVRKINDALSSRLNAHKS
jgi:hypothetical protein